MGPTLIEALIYRYVGYFEGDGEEYRTKEEVEFWSLMDLIKSRLIKLNKALIVHRSLRAAEMLQKDFCRSYRSEDFR